VVEMTVLDTVVVVDMVLVDEGRGTVVTLAVVDMTVLDIVVVVEIELVDEGRGTYVVTRALVKFGDVTGLEILLNPQPPTS